MSTVTPLKPATTTPAPVVAGPSATVETHDIRAAVKLVMAVMASDTRIGRVLGQPGTGKTVLSKWLAEPDWTGERAPRRVLRVCARHGMSPTSLVRLIAEAAGRAPNSNAGADAILTDLADQVAGTLVVIDEANHLRWQHIERVRWLSDECGAGLLLIGTDLLARTFRDARNAVYLEQTIGRIGAKQIVLRPMTAKELAAWVLLPRFGAAPPADVAKAAHAACHGLWRQACEIADAVSRIMEANGAQTVTLPVMQAAIKSLAAE